MHFSYTTSIINIAVMAIHAFLMLTAAVLIYIKHDDHLNRSKSFIFAFFLTAAIVATGEIIIILHSSQLLDYFSIMPPQCITMSGITYFLLLCYFVEVIRPYWLNWKRFLIVISPWLLLAVATLCLFLFSTDGLTHIYTSRRFVELIFKKPDLLVRFVMTGSLFLYTLWIMSICCFTKRYNPQRPYIRATLIILLAMTITFFYSRGMQFFWAYMIHEVLYVALTVLILYVEYYERLLIPYETVRSYYKPAVDKAPSQTQETLNQLSIKLCNLLEDPEVWQDPDLTRDNLVQMIGTNRTYLQEAVKLLGFKSLADMLYRRRIEYVCECLRQDPAANLQVVFYDAGFKSRTTAWRHFIDIVGCTPTEFIEKTLPPPPAKTR